LTLSQYFEEEIGGGMNRGSLLKLAALLHDVAKPQTKTVEQNGRARFLGHTKEGARIAGYILQRLRFSTREIRMIQKMIENHLRLWQMSNEGLLPTRRAIYRYFRDTGDVSTDIAFLTLADYLATYGPNLDLKDWKQCTQLIEYVLSQRDKEESIVAPPKLIDGHDLINIFNMEPGRQIGELLEMVREAQASGEITIREDALTFVQAQLARVGPYEGKSS
jgi:poly(A) polymerase